MSIIPMSITPMPITPMPITLRPASAADQPLIRQWVRRAHLNTLWLEWPNFLIAEQSNAMSTQTASIQIVGIGQLRPHRDGILELASIVVAPEVRGRGVGTMLVNALIAQADRPLYLMCDGKKVSYYQRFGFVEVTRRDQVPRALRGLYTVGLALAAILRVVMKDAPRMAIMAYPHV